MRGWEVKGRISNIEHQTRNAEVKRSRVAGWGFGWMIYYILSGFSELLVEQGGQFEL